jgi:Ca2+-transporting ATPase
MILFPIHVAFLHLVIEPACATVFENVGQEENLMRVPPRSVGESLIDAGAIWMILWQGLGILGLLFAVYLFSLRIGQSSEEARTLVFVALVLCSVGSIFAFSYGVYGSLWRALKENKALRRIVILVGPAIAAVLSVPALRRAFGFSGLHWIDLAMCLVSAVISALLLPRLFSYRLHGTPYPTSAGDR